MKSLLVLILTFALLNPVTAAMAAEEENGDLAEALRSLNATFPTMPVESIHTTPIDGVFEVVTPDRVVYFAPEAQLLFLGELFDSKGRSLTRERQAKVMEKRIEGIDLDKALKIGSGKNTVIEVTDPDCPFCRKGSEFLSQRDDVTRYIFFLPLKMHPEADEKVRFILSADNPAEVYEDVMAGRYDDQPLPEFQDSGRLGEHLQVVQKLGVRGTPKYWINGEYLSGADLERMGELLGGAANGGETE
ncbi:MAG: DsbC family protein [Geoalkalibacter sp.]|jgi:thiol:disulfide interchange protein DsbC|uniref:DsbC family protein n=1 Tax=Geoalkalibacter sp. TaxID=3041440 RepID=UPI002A991527|nr:DsbC family protein [Thermodesulfobacteriota bacterium]